MLLGLSLGISFVAVGCGSSSPKAFAKRSGKLACQTIEKCEEEIWKAAGYDSVSECVDDTTKEDDVEAFVDACDDFDRGAARKCLAAARKYKRSCDEADRTEEAMKDCGEVCGNLQQQEGLHIDPNDPESMTDVLTRALELSEERFEDEDQDQDQDQDEDGVPATFAP